MLIGVRKWVLLLALAGLGLFIAAGPLRAHVADVRAKAERFVKERTNGQSSEQISRSEFDAVGVGFGKERLQELVGTPQSKESTTVEGVRLECWYYGIAGGRGAYQFCFADGKLRSKSRFAA